MNIFSFLFTALFVALSLNIPARADDLSKLDPAEPGEELLSPITANDFIKYNDASEKIIKSFIKKGDLKVTFPDEQADLADVYDWVCIKKLKKKCVAKIKNEIALQSAWMLLNEEAQVLLPRLQKFAKKVVLKDSVKTKKVLDYFKSDYNKDVGDITLFILGTGTIQQYTPSGAASVAEYFTWVNTPSEATLNFTFDKSSMVGIKNDVLDQFTIKNVHIKMENGELMAQTVFKNILGVDHLMFVNGELYSKGGLEYEYYIAHELRHYLDSITNPAAYAELRGEQNTLNEYALNNKLGEADFDTMSKWASFKKLTKKAVQSMLKQAPKSTKLDKDTLEKGFLSFERESYLKEYYSIYGYINSTIEKRGYTEEVRYVRKRSSMTLDGFFKNLISDHVWMTATELHGYSDPILNLKRQMFVLENLVIVPNTFIDLFKQLFDAKTLDIPELSQP